MAGERLATVRLRLVDLHRQLLVSERVDLERFEGRLSGSEFLQIATDRLRLAWLLPLSGLIVEIDEALEEPSDVAGETSETLLGKVRTLLVPPSPLTPFGRRYLGILRRRPEVVVAHGALVAALRDSGAD
jgi:hypothetical protein